MSHISVTQFQHFPSTLTFKEKHPQRIGHTDFQHMTDKVCVCVIAWVWLTLSSISLRSSCISFLHCRGGQIPPRGRRKRAPPASSISRHGDQPRQQEARPHSHGGQRQWSGGRQGQDHAGDHTDVPAAARKAEFHPSETAAAGAGETVRLDQSFLPESQRLCSKP